MHELKCLMALHTLKDVILPLMFYNYILLCKNVTWLK